MPYIYFFTDNDYSKKDTMEFNKKNFKKNKLKIDFVRDNVPSDSELENLKKDADGKKFMVLVEVSEDCIQVKNDQNILSKNKLFKKNTSFKIHRIISIETKPVDSTTPPQKPLPTTHSSSSEQLSIQNTDDNEDEQHKLQASSSTSPNEEPIASIQIIGTKPLDSNMAPQKPLSPAPSSSTEEPLIQNEDKQPQLESSSSSNGSSLNEKQIAATKIAVTIEAIQDYLTLYKKIDIAAAKNAFYKKFPEVTKKIRDSDNHAGDAPSILERVNSEIKMDKGITRAIAHLLLLQSECLDISFKLLCLSSLFNTTNSTVLRQFVASTLASKTNAAINTEETNLNIKSIIVTQKNNVDDAIEKLGKTKNADFCRDMDSTVELTNAIELLYKGNEVELANSIPGSNNPASSADSLSKKKEKEVDSFQSIAKTAIEKYLIHIKHIEPKIAYQNFTENKNPKSTLFFFTSRDGINRALCYLNAIDKDEISEPNVLVVLGALLKTQKSKELRFYLASAILKFTSNSPEKIRIDNIDTVVTLAFKAIKLEYLGQSENRSATASQTVENTGFDVLTKSLSERIESNYQLDISAWFAEQTKQPILKPR